MSMGSEQILIFLLFSLLVVPFFKKGGMSTVLGFICVGLLIGPSLLKLVSDFESIMHFSELGIQCLLFIVGLEIHPKKLWELRKHLVRLGGLQVVLTTVILTSILTVFHFKILDSFIIGFGLSLSSTAFAMQSLIEKNQLKSEHGRSSFAILLMQDLVAIPALAVFPYLAQLSGQSIAQVKSPDWIKGLLIILGLLLASRLVIRPIFRLVASTRIREIFTALTLFIVLGVDFLMVQVGLSAALGAFIAGVLLADSEYKHELEAHLEPFKGLLMGLFFIAVGMSVNLSLFIEKPLILLSYTFGYLIVKSAIIYLVSRLFKLEHENAKLTALNVAQGGEFAFFIFGLAYGYKLLTQSDYQLFMTMIAFSMLLNPLLFWIDQRIENKIIKCKPEQEIKTNYDSIDEKEAGIIIAGFGRFGQSFGRILKAQNINFVAIDHDPQHIEMVRKFGNKVYYGDATRKEILEAAGIKTAKYFILCIVDHEVSLKVVQTIKEHYPHIEIFARARNRNHVFELYNLGVKHVQREVFDSSVNFVGELLQVLGFKTEITQKMISKFKQHDQILLQEQYKVHKDDYLMRSVSQNSQKQLEEILAEESSQSRI